LRGRGTGIEEWKKEEDWDREIKRMNQDRGIKRKSDWDIE